MASPLPLILLPVLAIAASAAAAPPQQEAPEPVPAPSRFESKIDDPMLAPLPPAHARVDSWEDALAMLRERSTDLRVSEASVQQAEGRWRQALGVLLPNASLNAGVAVDVLNPGSPVIVGGGSIGSIAGAGSGVTPTVPLLSGSASLTMPLVDLSAWKSVSSASSNERSARASLKDVQRRLTQGLAQAIVATVAAERAAEINRVGLRQALERYALATRSLELGASTRLDAVRVAQDVSVAREALVFGDEQVRRAREALGIALGRDGAVGVGTSLQLDGLVRATQERCAPLDALADRPDLVAAKERLGAAEASRSSTQLGYLPRLGLQSSAFGLTTDPGPGRFTTWNIAAVLSVPLWEGGRRGGMVKEGDALVKQAGETLEQARRDVTVEVAQSRRAVDVAEALLKTATEGRELADDTDRLTRRAFEVGRGSSLELVQSGAALRRAELTEAVREFELVQARLDAFLTEAQCNW